MWASVRVCECVFWLNGCVLRPAGLEQDQENILYDDMVSRQRPGLKPQQSTEQTESTVPDKSQWFVSGHHNNQFNWSFNRNVSSQGEDYKYADRINVILPNSCLKYLPVTSHLTEKITFH